MVKKLDIRIKPALEAMDDLIAAGESGKFDFVFVDANKAEYPDYYEKCLKLIRPGGFIAFDNVSNFLAKRHPKITMQTRIKKIPIFFTEPKHMISANMQNQLQVLHICSKTA